MSTRSGSLVTGAALILLTLVAWGLVYQLAVRAPDAPRLVSDATYYGDIARSLARGEGYVDRVVRPVQLAATAIPPPAPSGFWSPLYPALSALAFRLSGPVATITDRSHVPILVNLAGHLVAVVALFALARRLAPATAWIAPLGLALDPRALLNATDGLSEGWSAATLLLVACFVTGRQRWLPLAGLAFAAAVLTRLSNLAFLPVYVIGVALMGTGGLGRRLVAFGVPALVPLGAWAVVRARTIGSPFFEIQRFNVLHDLGAWSGSSAFRSLATPDPIAYLIAHPLDALVKLATGLAKCVVLLPASFWDVFALGAAAFGLAVLWRRRRGSVVLIAAPALVQLPVMALTLLDPRLWYPPSVPLWVAAAVGVGELARRLPAGRRRAGVGLAVALIAVVPLLRLAGDLATADPESRLARRGAVETESFRQGLGAFTRAHVPPDATLLTDRDEVVWTGDRRILGRPDDPAELPVLQRLSRPDRVLWELPDASGRREHGARERAWAAALGRLEARGALVRVADTTLAGRRIALSAWVGGS